MDDFGCDFAFIDLAVDSRAGVETWRVVIENRVFAEAANAIRKVGM